MHWNNERIEISEELRQQVALSARTLKTVCAPTSLGFNDVALMIAHSKDGETFTPIVNPQKLSQFLRDNYSAPLDAKSMSAQTAAVYFDRLLSEGLLVEPFVTGSYQMRRDVATVLCEDRNALKSPNINDLLFTGFKIFVCPESAKACRKPRVARDPAYVDYRTSSMRRYCGW